MLPSAANAATCSPVLPDLSLIVQRIRDPSLRARLVGLSGDDAQCIADFLSALLHEDTFSPEDKRYLLTLLRKLVKSTQVLPQSYKLQDIQCDFSQAREGGAFADIFQGEYQGHKICVKAVRVFQRGDNARMLRAFAKEIVLWAHLSHDNILPFYGIYQGVSGRICIISPWIDGGDLSTYLQSFPHKPRLPLASDVTAGLRYLHQSNIVHGDLKAKNILVSDRGRALIADFGISVIAVSIKLPSTQLSSGTMRWMAPELLKDDDENTPSVTLQSDVWSLGCVFYEILTRKVPFYQCVSDARVSLTRLDPMAMPSRPTDGNEVDNINDDMWDLMKKCWDHDPRSRPNCNDVHALITGHVEVRQEQCSQNDTLWKCNRGGTEVGIIYKRASRILFSQSSNSFMPGVWFYPPIVCSPVLADTQQPSQPSGYDHNQGDTADHHHTNVINVDDQQFSKTFHNNILQMPSLPRLLPPHPGESFLVPRIYSSRYLEATDPCNFSIPNDQHGSPMVLDLHADAQQLSQPSSYSHGQGHTAGHRHANVNVGGQPFYGSSPNEMLWAPSSPTGAIPEKVSGYIIPKRERISAARKRAAEYLCNICGAHLTSRENLQNHLTAHLRIKRFCCQVCGRTFTHKRSCDRHMKAIHRWVWVGISNFGPSFAVPFICGLGVSWLPSFPGRVTVTPKENIL